MDGKGGKIRFDLKQISAWDKQNENELKKKAEPKSVKGKPFKFDPSQQEGDGTGFDHGYRDRALERRKDLSTEESKKMEEIVSKLDAEHTKYLGGDMEHTHLVKGLDYALLEKVRKQKEKEDQQNTAAAQQTAEVTHFHQVEPSSQLGGSMLKFFSKQQASDGPSSSSSSMGSVAPKGASAAGTMLQRTVFDFDTRPESEVDIPLLVTRSRKEFTTNDEYVNFMLDSDIMAALSQLLESGKFMTAKQKKKKLLKEGSAELVAAITETHSGGANSTAQNGPPGPAQPVTLLATDFDSMYDDDVVVGKYVPAGLEEGETTTQPTSEQADASAKPSFGDDIYGDLLPTAAASASSAIGSSGSSLAAVSSASAASAAGLQSARDIFSNLPTAIHSHNNVSSSRAGAGAHTSSSHSSTSASTQPAPDLMKPIRDLLGAQAAKERAAKERILAQAVPKNRDMVVEKDEKGQLLVHRDVFLTTKDKIVNAGEDKGKKKDKAGEVFGTQGHYDLFPETTGSYEQYDSDEEPAEDGTAEPAAKKSKTEGGAKDKTSEWDRPARHSANDNSSASHGSGGFSKTIAGLEGSIKKSIATPWARHGSSGGAGGGGGGGGSGGAGGGNRAARRAAGAK